MPAVKPRSRVAVLSSDPVMARLIGAIGRCGLKSHAQRPAFETLARAIASQQLSGLVAQRILQRLCDLHAPAPFPAPEALLASSDTALRGVGFSYAKIRALRDLAGKVLDGTVPGDDALADMANDEIIARLTEVRGVGRWTVEMLLMFQLGRADVLPVDDFGVRNGFRLAYGLRDLPRPRDLALFGERWAPHRSAAAWYLWRAVDLHRAGILPEPARPAPRLRRKRRPKQSRAQKVRARK
jgi:DNA-3-methyladenine glycosylase II